MNEIVQRFRAVDLETASLHTQALVWQVGFCDYTITIRGRSVGFEVENLKLHYMTGNVNRVDDAATRQWMVSQGTYSDFLRWCRNAYVEQTDMELTQWWELHTLMRNCDRMLVANWADADLAWLKSNFEAARVTVPWKHRNKMCLGSLRNIVQLIIGPGYDLRVGDNVQQRVDEIAAAMHLPHAEFKAHMAHYDALWQAVWHYLLVCALVQEDRHANVSSGS